MRRQRTSDRPESTNERLARVEGEQSAVLEALARLEGKLDSLDSRFGHFNDDNKGNSLRNRVAADMAAVAALHDEKRGHLPMAAEIIRRWSELYHGRIQLEGMVDRAAVLRIGPPDPTS
ncbi:MAG: hypothetical protein ACR2FE_04020 [Aeromicrobium sp.]